MADEGKPGDIRETLGELEGRLREMEGDLRASAAGGEEEPGRPADGGQREPSGESSGRAGGWRPWAVAGVGLLVIAVAIAVAAIGSGGSGEEDPPPAEIALDRFPAGSDLARATAGVAGVRAARGDAGAEACVGSAQAALVIERDDPEGVGCRGLQRVLTVTASARAGAVPSSRRRCVAPSAITSGARRASRSLTRARARAQEQAARRAARAGSGQPRAATIRASRVASARAGTRFDRSRGLRLLAVRSGGRCVGPSQAALASGAYPLATRVTLLAQPDAVESEEVRALAASLRSSLAGPVPVGAWVGGR